MRVLGGAVVVVLILVATAVAGPSDPDPGFGSGGVVREDFQMPSSFEDVAVQQDGKLVAVGAAADSRSISHIALARHNPDGTSDVTFANGGRLMSTLVGSAGVDVGVTSDGRIVVVGSQRIAGTTEDQVVVERYTSTGTLDATFNPTATTPGRLTYQVQAGADTDAQAALVAADGTVTIAGTSLVSRVGESGFVLRVTPAGSLDSSFASGGVRLLRIANDTTRLTAVAANAAGKIAVAGEVEFAGSVRVDLGVARLTAGGSLDTTFNPSGPRPGTAYQIIDTGGDGRDSSSAGAVAIDAAGAVTAAGYAEQNASIPRSALARFTAAGAPDPAFGAGGYVKDTAIGAITDDARWDALEVNSAGALTVAGYGFTGAVQSVLVARYTAAGAADTTFNGTTFFRRYAPGTGAVDFAKGIARTLDDALVLAGVTTQSTATGLRTAGLLLRIGGQAAPGVPPTAGFTVSHSGSKAIRPGEVVTFTSTATDDGAVARDDWDLSGAPDLESTGAVVTHAYDTAGPVTVTHRVTDDQGLSATSSQTIEIVANKPPGAVIGANSSVPGLVVPPGPAKADTPYVLRADASVDSDGTIVRYQWDLDGTGGFEADTGGTSRITHTFPDSGNVHVRVQVTDDEGAADIADAVIEVRPTPDFALRVFENATRLDTVTVVRGQFASPSVVIDRIDGSAGPVSLTVDAPKGISTQFFPDALDRLTMRVSVGKSVAAGSYPLTIRGVPGNDDAGLSPRTAIVTVRVVEAYDVRVAGMEVTQGAQGPSDSGTSAPYLSPGPNFDQDPVVWPAGSFQRLVQGPRTVVRVFATAAGSPPVKGVTGVLYGFIAGTDAKLGAIASDQAAVTVAPGPAVATSAVARTAPGQLTFTLPNNWTLHDMDLRVVLTTPLKTLAAGNSEQCQSAACAANDTFQISKIPVGSAPTLTFKTLELRVGAAELPSADKIFDQTRALLPLGGSHFDLRPYAAVLDISDVAAYGIDDYKAEYGRFPTTINLSNARNNKVLDRVDQWTDSNTKALLKSGVDSVIGVNASQNVARGVSSKTVEYGRDETHEGRPFVPRAVVAADRLITSVAHETGHQIGRAHADNLCGGKGDAGFGLIQTDGLDRRLGSDGAGGYLLVYPGYQSVPDPSPEVSPGNLYDYMSYCAALSGRDSWIGTSGWAKYMQIFDDLAEQEQSFKARAAMLAAAGEELAVSGYIDADGNAVVSAVRSATGPAPSGTPAPYGLVTSDGSGAPGDAVPLTTRQVHIDDPTGPVELQLFDARVPATTRTVDVVDAAGRTLASRSASPTTPKVKLLTQTRTARIAGRGTTTVRARVIDPDPAPVPLSVDLRLGDGILRSTTARPGVVTFKVPNGELPRARGARFVVHVNDGWNEGAGHSADLRFDGAPPRVTIRGLPPKAIDANRTLVLEGAAFDDAGRPLAGKALRWFAGKRRVGTGADVSIAGLRAGRQIIRLVARDRYGRTATARLPVRVHGAGPQLIELSVPQRVTRTARTLPVRIATVLPATLRVAKRSFKVGPTPRTVRVPIKPGAGPLTVRGELVGAAGRRKVTLQTAR